MEGEQQQQEEIVPQHTSEELRAFIKQRAKLGLARVCSCDWPECARFQLDYTAGGDEDYGGPAVSISTERNQQYKDGVALCLGRVIQNDKYINIAKHHFDRRQIRYMVDGARLSTPLSEAELQKYTDTIDKNFKFYDERSKMDKYFNFPNITKEQVIADLQALPERRAAAIAEYEAVTFDVWRKHKREVQKREKELLNQVETLQAKLLATKKLLDESRKKVDNLNRVKRRRQKNEATRARQEEEDRAIQLQREQLASISTRFSNDHQTRY